MKNVLFLRMMILSAISTTANFACPGLMAACSTPTSQEMLQKESPVLEQSPCRLLSVPPIEPSAPLALKQMDPLRQSPRLHERKRPAPLNLSLLKTQEKPEIVILEEIPSAVVNHSPIGPSFPKQEPSPQEPLQDPFTFSWVSPSPSFGEEEAEPFSPNLELYDLGEYCLHEPFFAHPELRTPVSFEYKNRPCPSKNCLLRPPPPPAMAPTPIAGERNGPDRTGTLLKNLKEPSAEEETFSNKKKNLPLQD